MGECLRCGKCCRIIPATLKGLAPETIEWLKARGATVEGEYLLLPHTCDKLRGDNFCIIHDKPGYPKLCARYHGHGDRFYKPPGCGYLK